ncbi:Histone-lysine N-methyltransferase ATX2 [Camellia lanceoleosa]|uniref:Histone-lysine N-methyltransferase ATX2 n=1 Tax=Camellia lanceoleosa TaxID=1840588 RepID=A0ACC0FPZ7_9ERIC|nr:Histone-lysine N-methyltransferase ATX2 [Camellia lanceoleosa]
MPSSSGSSPISSSSGFKVLIIDLFLSDAALQFSSPRFLHLKLCLQDPKHVFAILWKSSQAAPKITAQEHYRLRIADGIIPEVDPSMENEEALGIDGMDGFLSNLANAIPGIDEAMSFAEMLNSRIESNRKFFNHSYLSEQKLPKRMLKMQNAVEADDCASGSREDEKGADSGEDCRGDERIHSKLEGTKTCPFEIGDLQVISLGKIVKDSEYF